MDFDFDALKRRSAAILVSSGTPEERLRRLCCFLHGAVDRYDWFGFYISALGADRAAGAAESGAPKAVGIGGPREDARAAMGGPELVLGPFAGEPTEHVRIPYGVGICGQAAALRETFSVDDVSAQDNYLACSLKVKSEIVVPIYAPRSPAVLVGEIDIDSHRPAAFGPEDRSFLEDLAALVSADVTSLAEAQE